MFVVMGSIRVLPASLVNRIAAGECVERPASVVKELVENALDAGAGRIDVVTEDGGATLIQVSDDGVGLEPDDLELAITPHATSKLQSDEDLFNIQTMGFRGEALASIASVARLELTSRRADSEVAYRLSVSGDGRPSGPTPCAAPCGTTVTVRDLFYCVPARRKFLKSPATESGHVTEQVTRLALAHPAVEFNLKSQQRVVQRLPATDDRRRRIADFLGPELAEALLPVRREGTGVVVEGLVAPPAESRGSNKWDYLFVNGRFVRDRFVAHAVREAYRSLIEPSRYPVTFLYITIDPAQVDVNVHPTKGEVRWRDANYIHGQVLAALRERFLTTRLDHSLRTERAVPDSQGSGRASVEEHRERVRSAMVDFFTRAAPAAAPRPSAPWPAAPGPAAPGPAPASRQAAERSDAAALRPAGEAAPAPPHPVDPAHSAEAPPDAVAAGVGPCPGMAIGHGRENHGQQDLNRGDRDRADRERTDRDRGDPEREDLSRESRGAAALPEERPLLAPADDRFRAIQIHNAYLVAETPDGLLLIDQHALHERILYEELRRRLAERRLESQRLLLPEIVRVPADRLEALESHADALARLGIELTAAGPASVAVQAFPTLLLNRLTQHLHEFVRDLLDLLGERGARPAEDTLLHEVLDMLACKAAVKAGDPLTALEIAALLSRRETAERSSHCPHGRPTTLHLTLRDLERQFRRR